MRAPWRKTFDPARDFQVRRRFTVGKKSFAPGEAFDKALVTIRRLRQLYDQRVIVFAGDTPGALVLTKRNRSRRPHVLIEEAEDALEALKDALAPGDPDPLTISTGAAGDAFTERSTVNIPEAWRELPWPQRKALGALLTDEKVITAADVEKAITAELERRGTA